MDRRAFIAAVLSGLAMPRGLGAARARLNILTWNIWMMPPWTFQSPRNEQRAEAIAAELLKLDVDVLCLQKAFHKPARTVLERALSARYAYRYGPANPAPLFVQNSGLWVFSRLKLSGYREIEFDERVGVERFARKGALFLSGTAGPHPFQLVNAHLQGDDGPHFRRDHQIVRNRQMQQIQRELVAPHAQAGVPLFVCGDMSTPRRDPRNPSDIYRQMLQTFGADNGADYRVTLDDRSVWNDLATNDTGRTEEMDYILVRSNGIVLQTEWTRLVLQHPGWDGPEGRRDLSYRYAVMASITFPETR